MSRQPRCSFAAAAARCVRREHAEWGARPVPVDDWLEELGARVLWVDPNLAHMMDGEPAWTYRTPGHRHAYATVLNPGLQGPKSAGRLYWTKGFEGGHIVLGHTDQYNAAKLSEAAYAVLHAEANAFTNELLMPEQIVLGFIRANFPPEARYGLLSHEIGQLKDHFRVSWEALMIRLEQLRIQHREVTQCHFDWSNGFDESHPEWVEVSTERLLLARNRVPAAFASHHHPTLRQLMSESEYLAEQRAQRRA